MTDIREIETVVYNSIQNTIKQVKLVDTSDGFDLKDVKALHSAVGVVITEVERLSKDQNFANLKGAHKKQVAAGVIRRFLSFDIPWIPGFLEEKIKKTAINFVIDYSVEFLNEKFGKDWLK